MSLAHLEPGLRSNFQGDFGECWLAVTAAGCGVEHGDGGKNDLIKADIELTSLDEAGGIRNPAVLVQVKTTTNLRDAGQHWAYDLDAETYEALRLTNYRLRRILAVVGVSANGDTLRFKQDGTLLLGTAAWASLEGLAASANANTQVVYLPKMNRLDQQGLRDMLKQFGVPRSTPVPEVSIWDETIWDTATGEGQAS